MSDYTARIKAVLDAQDAEKKLQELQKKKTVELVVKLTGDDTDCAKKFNKMMSSVTESAAKAGQQIRKLLSANTNLSNPKGDDPYNIAYLALKKLYDLKLEYAKIKTPDKDTKYLYEPRAMAKSSAIDSLKQKYQSFYDNNSAAHGLWGKQIKQGITELSSGAEISITRYNELDQQLINITNSARQAGKLGTSFFDRLVQDAQKISSWTSSGFIVPKTIQEIKQAVSSVIALDTALVDLRRTTAMSNSQLKDFYYTSNDIAKQTGVTTEEIINQASAWSRLGYGSDEDAAKMAEYSSMFASISPGMDADTATDGLANIMKAFDIGNDKPDDVLDGIMSKINVVGNTAATSNAEIVNMLSGSSSAMKEANNTLEETIALETAAVEITRDVDSVGTAFKTIAMRLRGYDEETGAYTNSVEELSDEIAGLTKTASNPGGISLFTDDAKTEYKSIYQLLKEISEIYDGLDVKTQSQLLETLAGDKQQGQTVAAAISNFEAAEKAMDSMADSTGSAEAEMSIIIDSIDYKINRLKETGTGIAQNLFNREDIKTVLDIINSFGDGLDWLTDKLGLFGSISLDAGLFAGIKNVGRVKCCPSC